MSERIFQLSWGLLLLIVLYTDSHSLLYPLIGWLVLEGSTNVRVIGWIMQLFPHPTGLAAVPPLQQECITARLIKVNFSSENATRLTAAVLMVLTAQVYAAYLWFFPWFLGFAFIGAGVSGVCPMTSFLKWLGFR